MTGEGFPFDLVLIALVFGIMQGVKNCKKEKREQAEEEVKKLL